MLRRLAAILVALVSTTLAGTSTVSGRSVPGHAPDEVSWPARRFAACGAVDDGTLYVYGGRADDGSTHHGDLWAMDLGNDGRARPSWRLATTQGAPGAPPAVRSCAATWDPLGDRLLVFGGWNGATHDGGVRAFDPATGEWEVLCDLTSCGDGPGPRRASQIVVDEERRRLVLFAGTNGSYFDDLCALPLDGGTWTHLPNAPISRGGHSMAIDPKRDALWLFGGTRPGSDLDDLWRFDLVADSWEHVTPGCPAGCPTPRSGATLVRDAGRDRMLLYGGWESSTDTYRRETWALDDLSGAPAWTEVVPDSESPQGRFFHVAGYDAEAEQMVIFGGGASGSAYRDAFGLAVPRDGSAPRWHTLSPTTPITARDQASVILDEGLLTAFGGFGSETFPGTFGAGTHLADTWQRPLGRRAAWRLATPIDETQVPLAREGAASALDSDGHRLLLFGGLDGDTTLADVWVAEVDRPGRPRWEQLCSPMSCGQGPSARWGAHAAYDAAGRRFVVFGGLTENGATTNDVWALDTSGTPTWHELTPPGPQPAARWSAVYGFDPNRRRLVVFGGQSAPDATGVGLQDTWALSLDGDVRWSQLATTGPRPMPRRSAAGAVRVTAEDTQLVVATGLTVAGSIHHNDVWSLSLSDDVAGWVQLAADAPGAGPAPRRSAGAVYDPVTDRLLLAFGRDAQRFFDETWAFDLTERTWHQLPG